MSEHVHYWRGDSIRLRAMERTDLALFEQLDDEFARNIDVLSFPQSKDRLIKWVEKELQGKMNDEFRWIAENDEGEAVGTIHTFACNRRFGTFKYGLEVLKPYWGRGYASEMILMVLRFYFMELGYMKVTPHVYEFNERSRKLHEKLGFVQEGRLRSMIYTNGQYYDEIHFGMTRHEFLHLYGE